MENGSLGHQVYRPDRAPSLDGDISDEGEEKEIMSTYDEHERCLMREYEFIRAELFGFRQAKLSDECPQYSSEKTMNLRCQHGFRDGKAKMAQDRQETEKK